jgi:hypothetical protein
MPAGPEALIEQAEALESEAAAGSEGAAADTLRLQAAELRRQALGPRPYPVLICGACYHLTGWLDADGVCVFDALRRREHTGRGFYDVRDARVAASREQTPLLRRARRALGIAGERDRVAQWLAKVEPAETGPPAPEEGWELEAPVKYERRDPAGVHVVVCFDVQSVRFDFAEWQPVDATRGGKPRTLVPREFPASLPIAQLAEAWNDFVEDVAGHNRRLWRAESDRRDAAYVSASERRAADELEGGTSGLL